MRVLLLCLLTLLTVCQASLAGAAETNWPQFRGPRGDGQSPNKGLPLTWSENENIRWKTPIPGKAWSSPVVWNDQIWVTNATEDGKQLSAVCVDAASGRIVHNVVVFAPESPQYCHNYNSYASSTPVIEQGRIYVHFGSHGTACLDTKTGATIWSRTDLPCDHHRGAGSSPVVFENLLIVAYDGFDQQYIVAFDKQTGKTVWKKDRNIDYGKNNNNGDWKKAYGTAQVIDVNGNPQVVAPSAGATISYNPRTGEELWRVTHGGMNAAARPLFGHGRLYVDTADGGFKLFAVRPDGRGEVAETHVDWKLAKNVPSRSSQLLIGDLIFMVNEASIASCVDAMSGTQIWQHRFGGDYCASPIYADGRIYFFSEFGICLVIEPGREFKLLAENKLGSDENREKKDDGFMASPAVTGKALILRTRSHLYRIEEPSRNSEIGLRK